ncbi:MAG: primosomal protein DnaI [Bacilli bacterium]|nr:primosomal protein DnaI [Bacilli bacterium]
MLKVDKLVKSNKDLDIKLKQEYIKALEDKKFKEFIECIKIDDELLIKYTSRLKEASLEFHHCLNCKGLGECKNKVKGFALVPSKDNNRVSFSYKSCNYKNKESYKENVELFDVPYAIKNASLKDLYKDKNRIELIKKMKSYLSNYFGTKEKAIYLHGSFGSGKTYLIAALINELAKKDVKGIVIHLPEFLRGLKESFSSDYSEKFDAIKKVPVLLIDDIGAEYLTNWARDEVLEPILQYRMDENLATFFTSNFTMEELESHLSVTSNSIDRVKAKRIIERIKQLSEPCELVSKNYRE